MSLDTQTAASGSVEFAGRDFYLPDLGRTSTVSHVNANGSVVLSTGAAVTAHNGVALPMVGELVALPREGGVLRGYWMGLARPGRPEQSTDRVRVLLLVGGEVVEHDCEASAVAADQVVVGRAEPGMAEALRALHAAREQTAAERQAHETWKADFGAAACERADRMDLCSQFDDFMEDWGLQRRTRSWSVEVVVTARVFVSVEARSAEDAESSVDLATVEDALRSAGTAGLSGLDYEVRDAE